MSNLFKTLEYEAFRAGINPRTKQSRDWFRKKAQEITSVNRRKIIRNDPIKPKSNFIIGEMYMYFYDPKHKETLPYYDKFPLTIIVDFAKDGFYGLNLHYLPMTLRAKFLDGLLDTATNEKYDKSTRFRVTYNMLKRSSKMRYFKPCFKHYLADHVRGNFAYVPPTEWEIATFLPTADFKGATENKVYRDSRKAI